MSKRLRAADVPESQAEAQAEALRDALADQAAAQAKASAWVTATKADVSDVRGAIIEVRGDVKLLKWMLGVFIAAATPLIVRAYLGG